MRSRLTAIALAGGFAGIYHLRLRRAILTWGSTAAHAGSWLPEDELGLNMHTADRVLPEFQHPEVGDTIFSGSLRMRLARVGSDSELVWRSEDSNRVWTSVPESHQRGPRLISRNRFRLPTLTARVAMVPMEAGSLVMKSKLLRGIKQRAKGLASATPEHSGGRIG